MSTYAIDYSEPLRPGFEISAGALDGPSGSTTHSSLRLYGRGALEWGEAVDENMLRLSETFCGASPPANPNVGQLWAIQRLYYRNLSVSDVHSGWYRYNLTTHTWELLNGTGVVPAVATTGQTYYYDGSTLFGKYALTSPQAASFVPRAATSGTGAPTSAPRLELVVYNRDVSGNGTWVVPACARVTSTGSAPGSTSVLPSSLWFEESSGLLKLWTGSAWQEILGPTSGVSTVTANLSFANTHRGINVPDPVSDTDIANKRYVDSVSSTGVDGVVRRDGSVSMIAGLVLSGNATAALHAVPKQQLESYVTAQIAAIPGDKYLQGLQSYNSSTNQMTLLMSDGSTVVIDMTNLLNDATAQLLATPGGALFATGPKFTHGVANYEMWSRSVPTFTPGATATNDVRGCMLIGISAGSGDLEIPYTAFYGPGTDIFTVFNDSTTVPITLTPGTGVTSMRLLGQPLVPSGVRTIDPLGMATVFLTNLGHDVVVTGVGVS